MRWFDWFLVPLCVSVVFALAMAGVLFVVFPLLIGGWWALLFLFVTGPLGVIALAIAGGP